MIGKTVHNYTLLKKLGTGGFGTVYKAQHNHVDGLYVAAKFMHKDLAHDESYLVALKRECLLLNLLDHPNIVGFRDLRLDHDPPVIFMEFLEGDTIGNYMKEKRFTISEVLFIGQECLKALHFAHGKNTLHRDIKPENIFLGTDGRVKVGDFGLAKQFTQTACGYTETIRGTLNYLAPEVFSEQIYIQQTDIYALGLTLWELLAHKPACIKGSMIQKINWHMEHQLEDVRKYSPECPDELYQIVLDMCHPDKDKRIQSAEAALERWPTFTSNEVTNPFGTRSVSTAQSPDGDFISTLSPEAISNQNDYIEDKAIKWVFWGGLSTLVVFLLSLFIGDVDQPPERYTKMYKEAAGEGVQIADNVPLGKLKAKLKMFQEEQKMSKIKAFQMGFDYIYIQPQEFVMGCTREHGRECHPDELPTHKVALSQPFEIMKSEVTATLYKKVMKEEPKSKTCGDNCPVYEMSWFEAIQFANRLNQLLGNEECYILNGEDVYWPREFDCDGWRLPTEAEWEYAARANSPVPYAGSSNADFVAWHQDNADGHVHPVCTKKKNAFGLCDMSGNVWEWVWDKFGIYHPDENNLMGPLLGETHVIRGGSFEEHQRWVRTVVRVKMGDTKPSRKIGFRLVRSRDITYID